MRKTPCGWAARTSPALIVLALCCGSSWGAQLIESLSVQDLQQVHWSGSLISNGAFAPDATAAPARESFAGTLVLHETRMTTLPAAFKSATVLGREPQLFPAVKLTFFTAGGDLVPLTQDLIPAASVDRGRSYWDLIVQPGVIWSAPGDRGWSRAGFPFALVNSLEGETHNGVATFAYRRGVVTNVRLQIVQQTAPFYVIDYFTATAQIPATLESASAADFKSARVRYRTALRDPLPIARWEDLAGRLPSGLAEKFDDGKSAADVVLSALDFNGTVYLKACNTAAGPLPWCDRARFGVWSATKSLVNEVALLRLAQKYGPGVFEERIVDYLPEAAAYPGWRNVRFADAANMATGVGNGTLSRTPNNILDGGLEQYGPWYEAGTKQQKIRAALAGARAFPWGPGQVTRYRDQDMFILGVAMDNYVKSKEGVTAGIWTLVVKEVFEPIGIHDSPIDKTREPSGRQGQPLMAFGFYPTIADIVRIARLYQHRGAYGRRQLLYAPRINAIFSGSNSPGLPTGQSLAAGAGYYFNTFWKTPYITPQGCKLYYPQMEGWGGTVIALFPGKLSGIRIAKIWEDDTGTSGTTMGMAAAADYLENFDHDGTC